MGRLRAILLHAQQTDATCDATTQQASVACRKARECDTQQHATLTRLMRAYADHHGFTHADYSEALQVALGNIEGWLIYLRTQPECSTVH